VDNPSISVDVSVEASAQKGEINRAPTFEIGGLTIKIVRLFGIHRTGGTHDFAYAVREYAPGRWTRIAYYEHGHGWTKFPSEEKPTGHRKLRVALMIWKLKR